MDRVKYQFEFLIEIKNRKRIAKANNNSNIDRKLYNNFFYDVFFFSFNIPTNRLEKKNIVQLVLVVVVVVVDNGNKILRWNNLLLYWRKHQALCISISFFFLFYFLFEITRGENKYKC